MARVEMDNGPRELRRAGSIAFLAHLILEDLAHSFGRPLPNVSELMCRDARNPKKPRLLLNERVADTVVRTDVPAITPIESGIDGKRLRTTV